MKQLGKRAFRSYWDCFSHSWEVIWSVLCKCDQEKNRVDVCSFIRLFIHSFTPSPFSVSLFPLHHFICLFLSPQRRQAPVSTHLRFFSFYLSSPSSLLTLPSHSSTFSNLTQHLSSAIQISLFLSPFLSPSQVTPARPLIRILSLSKCIVTGG